MPTMTAAQQRERAKQEFDAFLADCPSRLVLDRISDKWVTLVIASLSDGPLRFSELSRQLAGVSQKMLTQTLRTLERDGLVTRTVTRGGPGPRRLRADRPRPLAARPDQAPQGLGGGPRPGGARGAGGLRPGAGGARMTARC